SRSRALTATGTGVASTHGEVLLVAVPEVRCVRCRPLPCGCRVVTSGRSRTRERTNLRNSETQGSCTRCFRTRVLCADLRHFTLAIQPTASSLSWTRPGGHAPCRPGVRVFPRCTHQV